MARKRRRSEPSGRQIIQAQQMFQNLLIGLDTAGVQRLLEGREVLAALADGRLTPKKALAAMGLPVRVRQRTLIMDFIGHRKAASEEEVLESFARQGLRPATEEEFKKFWDQHPDIIHDIVIRSRYSIVVMAKKTQQMSFRPRQAYWCYPIYGRDRDGKVERYEEAADTTWDKGYRFIGVRTDPRPEIAIIPSVSLRHVSPKVRPLA